MRKICNVTGYYLHSCILSNKLVMPLAALVAILYCMYTIMPTFVVDSFNVSCVWLFFLMVWTGMTLNTLEDPIAVQLLILRVGRAWKCYAAETLFYLLVAVFMGTIAALFPVLQNILNKGQLFIRPLLPEDVIFAWLLLCASAMLGASVGHFFHPGVMKNRKLALLLTALAAILAIVKTAVIMEFPWSKTFLWLVPPVADMIKRLSMQEFYPVDGVMISLVMILSYTCILVLMRILLQLKRKF